MLKTMIGVVLALLPALTLSQVAVLGQDVREQQSQDAEETGTQESSERSARARAIEGVWDSTVTVRRCNTGDPIINIRALNMFNRGGTLTETGSSSPTLRGPSLGTWYSLGGRRYSSVFTFLRFNPDETFAGTQRVIRTIELSKDTNEFTATGSFEVFDTNDNIISAGCATETAKRLE